MSFVDTAGLALELAQNLRHGRAFVQGAGGVEVLADCTLVLVRADGVELRVGAQAVMVSDAGAICGVGLELRPFGAEVIATLEAFAAGEGVPESAPRGESLAPAINDDAPDDAQQTEIPLDPATSAAEEPDEEPDEEPWTGSASTRPPDLQAQQVQHERLRRLTQIEQQKLARLGDLTERVTLERLYGKGVWESLLHNPKLTVPEVARIARKGTMPRPLLDFILDNASWTQSDPVRRALLGNPRVSSEGVLKLLRATPKHELKTIVKSTAYAASVRDVARKLLKI